MQSPERAIKTPGPHNISPFRADIAARSQSPPRTLYKYTSCETALTIMQTGRLRFQSPLNFNDPFDGQWNVLWQLETPEYLEHLVRKMVAVDVDLARILDPRTREEIESFRAEYAACASTAQKEQCIVKQVNRLDPGIIARPRLPAALDKVRLLCLSAIPDSLLMWAYYGDHHRGAVLGFNAERLEATWQLAAHPVAYVDALPPMLDPMQMVDVYIYDAEIPELDGRALAQTWSLSKAEVWAHEKEWRFGYINPKAGADRYEDVSFPKEALVQVAVGCQSDQHAITRLQYETLSKFGHARFIEAKRHSREFALVGLRY